MVSINTSPSFGKTAILECSIKDFEERKSHYATLYKLNPDSLSDVKDVARSKNTNCIKNDFKKAFFKGDRYNSYYILQDDKTGEVISCAQASHRYNRGIDNGYYTFISALSENKKFLNGAEPILSYMTRVAAERYDKIVCAPYNIKDSDLWSEWRANELHSIKDKNITDCGANGVYIPENRFLAYLDKTEKRNQISYLV